MEDEETSINCGNNIYCKRNKIGNNYYRIIGQCNYSNEFDYFDYNIINHYFGLPGMNISSKFIRNFTMTSKNLHFFVGNKKINIDTSNKITVKDLDSLHQNETIYPNSDMNENNILNIDDGEKIVVNFKNIQDNSKYSIEIGDNASFRAVEIVLYNKYPHLRNWINSFIFNGRIMNINNSLSQNHIKDKDTLIITSVRL